MKKYIFFSLVIVLLFLCLVVWQFAVFSDHRLHIVFCNVGQGDGIFIITPANKHILLDGGPNDEILSCLSRHMPFWERTIDVMILSHPHADHLNGLIPVLERYTVRYFATEPLANKTAGYDALLREIKKQKVKSKDILAGDRIRIEKGITIDILGPSEEFLKRTSPKGTIGESSEFGSLIQLLSYGDFDVLLDGDSQVTGMKQAAQGDALRKRIEVLQVPHHGSKYGLDESLIKAINPKLAVISVGKNNYGHPAPKIITLLQNEKVKYLRTDVDGEIEIISDGKKFWIK